MRAIIQRVSRCSINSQTHEQQIEESIGAGLLVYIGFSSDDTDKDIAYICRKIAGLRIFNDSNGTMNLSVLDIKGDIAVVSQFTLYGDARKGNRPSYNAAASATQGLDLYNRFLSSISEMCPAGLASGRFQAHMDVDYTNDGPVTILLDSQKHF